MCGPCGESCGGALRDTMLVKGDTGHAASRAPHISRARHVRHARPQPGVGRSGSGTPRSRPRACPAAPTRTRWPGIIRWPETQVQVNRVAAAWRPSPGSVRDAGRQRSLLEERTRPGTPRPGARPGASPPLVRGVGWLTAGLRRSCPCGMPWAATAFFFELHLGCSWSRSQATFPGPGPDRRGSRSLLQSNSAIIRDGRRRRPARADPPCVGTACQCQSRPKSGIAWAGARAYILGPMSSEQLAWSDSRGRVLTGSEAAKPGAPQLGTSPRSEAQKPPWSPSSPRPLPGRAQGPCGHGTAQARPQQ